MEQQLSFALGENGQKARKNPINKTKKAKTIKCVHHPKRPGCRKPKMTGEQNPCYSENPKN